MELQLGPEVISSYKRLAYTHWYALAEFIDNSTQAYFHNKGVLDALFSRNDEALKIKISYGSDSQGDFISIEDNSIGMSKEELERAVIIGRPPEDTSGRSKYGLGLKTAACWFGDIWTINTKKLGDNREHIITINVPEIAIGHLDLAHHEIDKPAEEHFTTIKIRDLHHKLLGGTVPKAKDYLRSMYRVDISEYGLQIYWQGNLLTWSVEEEIDPRLLRNREGDLVKRTFSFDVGVKSVDGWAGVFEKGSRADAGFSIIQAKRVIKGWPSSYRPQMLFGIQEGGRNDLVNQRLVGELYFEGFDVSHTKDAILFTDEEEEELEVKLHRECTDLRELAQSYRKYMADERSSSEQQTDKAINEFEKELKSDEIVDGLFTKEIPTSTLIKETNKSIKETVMSKLSPSIEVTISEITVLLYIVEDMSPNDPYVILESTESKERVVVIVNRAHPHWTQLNNQESIMNFLRHCTYDGVAEWKAYFMAGTLDPDTVKLIKDNLLRVPFEIEQHEARI